MEEIEKLKQESKDITEDNISKIALLFPNCITECKDKLGNLKKVVNFEILHQMLSKDLVTDGEHYEFTWPGKSASILEANTKIRKTLRPCTEESKDWEHTQNLYIEGDNLDALKLLQESYLGKVKMIYIDPPYNTGTDSFVYPDSYEENSEEYDLNAGVKDDEGNILFKENPRTNPRFHSKWCSMMYQRLLLARTLLSDEGAIFIHIDENEVYTLAMICNEIFGNQNELGTIIWDKRNPKGVVAGVAYQHESILVYCKNITKFARVSFSKKKEHANEMVAKVETLIKKHGGVTEEVRQEFKEYIKQNKNEFTGGESAYSLIDDNGNIYQPVSMAAPDKPETRSHRALIHPKTGKPCPVPAKGWRFTDPTMDDLINRNKIEFGKDENTQPRQKYFLKDNMEEAVSSLLYFGGNDDALGLPFDNPKPVYVAKKIISSLCKEDGDIVLDFFSGSATTAHAVMELNLDDSVKRKFIMVQYPEKISNKHIAHKQGYNFITDIGKERIKRAAELLKEKAGIISSSFDLGFRVLKVSDSNMKDVYYNPDALSQDLLASLESNIKEDRSGLDLLFSSILDLGLTLDKPIKEEVINGKSIIIYNDDTEEGADLIACFEDCVDEELIKEIAKRKPTRAVFKDSSFINSPTKINIFEIFKLYAGIDSDELYSRVKVI